MSSDEESLDAALLAAQGGDPEGFALLWTALAPAVTGYLRSLGAADADDLTSEVFLAAFRGLDGFTGEATAFRTWLFTIAHHRRADHFRARARQVPTEELGPRHEEPTSASAEELALARIEAHQVQAALGRLTQEQREVVALRVLADLSIAQVAEVLGRTPQAVKALQHRGLATLKRALTENRSGKAAPFPGSSTITDPR